LGLAAVRNRLWNNTGFFLVVWAVHYVPFFLMNRQLFVHHYLPSHLASALIAGAMLSFVLSETINYPISHPTSKTRLRPSQYADVGYKGLAIFAVYSFILFMMFIFIAPLTYGTPGYVYSDHLSMVPETDAVFLQIDRRASQQQATFVVLDPPLCGQKDA
jgi:dolichyl-phosphate-mannose--protein O-mannosyl transferase